MYYYLVCGALWNIIRFRELCLHTRMYRKAECRLLREPSTESVRQPNRRGFLRSLDCTRAVRGPVFSVFEPPVSRYCNFSRMRIFFRARTKLNKCGEPWLLLACMFLYAQTRKLSAMFDKNWTQFVHIVRRFFSKHWWWTTWIRK